MAQCLLFFNTTWAFGITFLISNVGYVFHQNLTRYTGFFLDLNEKYLIVIRYLSQNCNLRHNFKKVLFFRWFIVICIIIWLFFLLIAIHKTVNYCMKHFKDENDQDFGEDIGAKFLLCPLDSWVQVTWKKDDIVILHKSVHFPLNLSHLQICTQFKEICTT